MVTKIVFSQDVDDSKVFKCLNDFNEKHNIFLQEYILAEDSDCGEFEYVYLFLDNYLLLNSFFSILRENKIEPISHQEYTDEMVKVISENRVEEFKSKMSEEYELFDFIIEDFTLNNITKDMVLDKMLNLGQNSLNEVDYKILNS
jgi:hypothetical protein